MRPQVHCISAEEHDRKPGRQGEPLSADTVHHEGVTNFVVHYFGCVDFCEREAYFGTLDETQKERIRDELRRVRRLKRFVEKATVGGSRNGTKAGAAKDNDGDATLAAVMLKKNNGEQQDGRALVRNVRESLSAWRHYHEENNECLRHMDGLKKYWSERSSRYPDCNIDFDPVKPEPDESATSGNSRAPAAKTPPPFNRSITETVYDPDRDIKGYLLQYTLKDGEAFYQGTEIADDKDEEGGTLASALAAATMATTATAVATINAKKLEIQRNKIWKGRFPTQKATVYDLLRRPYQQEVGNPAKPNYLHHNYKRDANNPEEKLRYFHFPSNNMNWVEEAIGRYYGEHLDYDESEEWRPRAVSEKRTDCLLRHELWKGQQHGTGSGNVVHSRHLRPLCELVCSNPKDPEQIPKDIVLYMPVLHWDTDRKRSVFADTIDRLTTENHDKQGNLHKYDANQRRTSRMLINNAPPLNPRAGGGNAITNDGTNARRMMASIQHRTRGDLRNASEVAEPQTRNEPVNSMSQAVVMQMRRRKLMADIHGRGKGKSSGGGGGGPKRDRNGRLCLVLPLAQLLYDAARLMEAMENHRDTAMLKEYLFKPSPLHPRRTLDQAYYCSIRNTRARDRDQVVYRETTPRADGFHQWEYNESGKVVWKCQQGLHGNSRKTDVVDPKYNKLARKRTGDDVDETAEFWSSCRARKIKKRCRKCYSAKRHEKSWFGQVTTCPAVTEDTTDPSDDSDDSDDSSRSEEDKDHFPSAESVDSNRNSATSALGDLCRICKIFDHEFCQQKHAKKEPGKISQLHVMERLSNAASQVKDGIMDNRCSLCNSAAIGCLCRKGKDDGLRHRKNAATRGKTDNQNNKHTPSGISNRNRTAKEYTGESVNRRCQSCRDNISRLSRLVMVDQLWMWILDEHTILTFFPRRYGFNRNDTSGIHRSIRTKLESPRSKQIRSVFDLALVVLQESTKTFFDRTRTLDRQPLVLDLFSEAIGRLTYKQTLAFQHLWDSADELRKRSSATTQVDLSGLHIPLLNIVPEGKLQREIKDILDELSIMIHIVKQQKEVIEQFQKNVKEVLSPFPEDDVDAVGDDNCVKKKKKKLKRFELSSNELLLEIQRHLNELDSLKESATSTSVSLDQLLTLKQQQASVIQAWQSIKHGEEAVKQGRAIIVFTTMTIVFLPLAFIAAIFGMNNPQLDAELRNELKLPMMSLRDQIKYMVSISSGITILVLVLAFSSFTRALFASLYLRASCWLLTRFWLYRLWLRLRYRWSSERQWRRADAFVAHQKAEEGMAMRRRFGRRLDDELRLRQMRREARKKHRKEAEARKRKEDMEKERAALAAASQGGVNDTGGGGRHGSSRSSNGSSGGTTVVAQPPPAASSNGNSNAAAPAASIGMNPGSTSPNEHPGQTVMTGSRADPESWTGPLPGGTRPAAGLNTQARQRARSVSFVDAADMV